MIRPHLPKVRNDGRMCVLHSVVCCTPCFVCSCQLIRPIAIPGRGMRPEEVSPSQCSSVTGAVSGTIFFCCHRSGSQSLIRTGFCHEKEERILKARFGEVFSMLIVSPPLSLISSALVGRYSRWFARFSRVADNTKNSPRSF